MFSVNADGLNGKLTESTTYSKDSVLMRKLSYSYMTIGNNPALSDIIFFPWTRCLNMNPGRSSFEVYYKYSLYPKYPINVLPNTTTEALYDSKGNKTTSNTTSFLYNPTNYQIWEQTVSNGVDTVRTSYWYPSDKKVTGYASLVKKHILSEVTSVETYRNSTFTGGSKYKYTNVTSKALNQTFPVVKACYSILPNASRSSVAEMTVKQYDDYGNIREYEKKNGTPVTLIWSYNHQLPVMEIVGKRYDDVKNTFGSIITSLEEAETIDRNDGYGICGPYSSRNDMDNAFSAITPAYKGGFSRGAAEAYVTTYEYTPWRTLSRIIKPNGLSIVYIYDEYGRLKETREDNSVIQKYSYNYSKK